MSDTVADELTEPFPWSRAGVDPPALYEWLREQRPVTRVHLRDGQPVWLVSRYDDVRAVLAHPDVSADVRQPGFPRIGAAPRSDADRPFLRMDPPEHTVFRRLLARYFTGRRVEQLRPATERLVSDTIDAMEASGTRTADLVPALTLPVPSTVLSWILGVPAHDSAMFNAAAADMLNGQDPNDPEAIGRAIQAGGRLRGYLADLAAQRAAAPDPGDDILGTLVSAARDGTITDRDVVNSAVILIIAGHDTTAAMAALGTVTLLGDPSATARLRDDPALMPSAVEELLRFLTVVQLVVLRVARADVEVAGVVIPAGEGIVPLIASADRDGAHYPHADRFDLDRTARDHLAFGFGVHQCMGQQLARMELSVILGTLLRRLPGLRLAVPVDQLDFRPFSQVTGVTSVPVAW